jgi:hypothetical protein
VNKEEERVRMVKMNKFEVIQFAKEGSYIYFEDLSNN